MQKPQPSEYKPYFKGYIDLVPEGDFIEVFKQNTTIAIDFFESIPPEKFAYRYAEGKWTVKEILMHITDTDRIFTFRALVAGRGDSQTPLHPIDENLFARNVDVTNRSMESLVREFSIVRKSAEIFFEHLTSEQSAWPANNITNIITPRAYGYIIMGHMLHHIGVIKEKYL